MILQRRAIRRICPGGLIMEVSCILIKDEGKITAAGVANAEQRNSKFLRQREDPRGPLERATNGGQVEAPYLIVFHVITDTWTDVLYTHVFAYAYFTYVSISAYTPRAVPENALFIGLPFPSLYRAAPLILIPHSHSLVLSLKTRSWFILDWPRAHLLLVPFSRNASREGLRRRECWARGGGGGGRREGGWFSATQPTTIKAAFTS